MDTGKNRLRRYAEKLVARRGRKEVVKSNSRTNNATVRGFQLLSLYCKGKETLQVGQAPDGRLFTGTALYDAELAQRKKECYQVAGNPIDA